MPKTSPPIEDIMPPLILGCGTFNTQYNPDPFALPAASIVSRALELGVGAFDTSPYYGPSEQILGDALQTPSIKDNFSRRDYFLITKAGRVGPSCFDYSPEWIRASVARSLARLHTDYLDVVYCHDVEFVSPADVLAAVTELRRLRDTTGTVKYVGISGFPVGVLADLAQLVLTTTGEPLDAVMSYASFTLQNSTLLTQGLPRLQAAGVGVVPNASILGMGLLRTAGLPVGAQGDWHPTPTGLRAAARQASEYCLAQGDRLEKVAIRYSLEGWLHGGAGAGTRADPPSGIPWARESNAEVGGRRLGASVIGTSSLPELDSTLQVWRSILDTLDGGKNKGKEPDEKEWGRERMEVVRRRAEGVRACFGEWVDFAWDSPPPGFINEENAEREGLLGGAGLMDQQERNQQGQIQEGDVVEEGGNGLESKDYAPDLRFGNVKDVPGVGPIEFVDADKLAPVVSAEVTPGGTPAATPLQRATILDGEPDGLS